MPLLSKLQYKNFEPGEFTGQQQRSYEQTIALIESFPWEAQRDHLRVDLTNPSVTIQDAEGNFLKLALYYNGKFVLHFFDLRKKLYTKSFVRYPEAYPYINAFFDHQPFDTAGLKLENTWPKNNLVHFADKDFHYLLTPKRIKIYLLSTSGGTFAFNLFLLGFILWQRSTWLIALLSFLPFILLFGGGPNLLLFANYYRFSKGKILIMSKGNPLFSFGPLEKPEQFDKKDILTVRRYKPSGSRSLVSGFAWVEIGLWGGRSLIIPNLLIDDLDLVNKLADCPLEEIKKAIPSIPL